jgi:hypothetical protein
MKAKGSTLRSRCSDSYFDEMPPEVRRRAEEWFAKFRDRWEWNLPNWRLAILVGQARRLALNPPSSAWGRSMLAKRGGRALQRSRRERRAISMQEGIALLRAPKKPKKGATPRVGARSRSRLNDERPLFGSPEKVSQSDSMGGPSPEVHAMHTLLDPPGCRCYYCAWPYHER